MSAQDTATARRPPAVPAPVARVALTRNEAAVALAGMSLDTFERYVQPHLCLLRIGRLVLVPIAELERFAKEHAERTIP